ARLGQPRAVPFGFAADDADFVADLRGAFLVALMRLAELERLDLGGMLLLLPAGQRVARLLEGFPARRGLCLDARGFGRGSLCALRQRFAALLELLDLGLARENTRVGGVGRMEA